MPIYEYICLKCEETTEAILHTGDEPPTACPSCGGELKKLLSAPSFQFKGSGWYVTDYARKGSAGGEKEAPKGNGDKSASSSEGSGSKTETKASSETKTPANKT